MKEAFSLEQLLADPLIRMVMSDDAVEEGEIRRLAARLTLGGVASALVGDRAGAPSPARETLHLAAAHTAAPFAAEACCG